jgi:EAL domain-containing protein (putative c-di-GMP-specific phosphodiesterase class I)/ActR/RegA family two-component response regulator
METTQSILVIDDDPGLGEFITAAAEHLGVRCMFTTDPATFFKHLTPEITLVLVDLVMPNVDGVQIMRLLAQGQCKAKIVMMSGLGRRVMQTAEQLAVSLGLSVVGHLRKPIRLLELEAIFATPNTPASGRTMAPARNFSVSDEELSIAVREDQFVNHYQPLIAAATGDVIGVEALVRWQHPLHGLIYPDAFIARTETLGLADRLGWIVTQRAFSDIGRFATDSGVVPALSINVSVHSLQVLTFPDTFEALAAKHGVALEATTLEITESGLVRELPATLDVLTRLRMKRVELSIDDFGTGYSMMQQLKTIPATELKIDKTFVQNANISQSDHVVVTKSIEIGHELGMRVVAEGVETMEQFEFLRAQGCDVAQGYLFSRPLPATQLVEWLQTHRAAQSLPPPTTIINP